MTTDLAFLVIIIAALLDIVANLLMKKSDGFKHKKYGIGGTFLVCVAFGLLAQVTTVMDLAVAYALWGAIAIFGTAMAARYWFAQKINRVGWLGICMIVLSIVLLKSAE